jgi:type I restriction enzyme S subunit
VSWPRERLGSVAELAREGVHPQSVPAGTRYVGLENISSDGVFSEAADVSPSQLASTKCLFTERHILFGKLRPYLRKTVRPTFAGICSTDIIPIAPSSRIDRNYLFHFLRTDEVVERATSMASGANLPRISPRHLVEFEIPLPPLAEQQRIAAILDQADTLRRKRREAISKLNVLESTTFVSMFGNPLSLAGQSEPPQLGDVVNHLTYGPRFYNEEYVPDGTRIVRITDLDQNGGLDFEAMPKLKVSAQVLASQACRPGDIIFARTGATVGKIALIEEGMPECIPGAYFITMRFQEHLRPQYVASLLRSEPIQKLIERQSRQAAQQNFSGPGLKRLPLPSPVIELQDEFCRIVEQIAVVRGTHRRNLAHLDSLFASLQHRAFCGEL